MGFLVVQYTANNDDIHNPAQADGIEGRHLLTCRKYFVAGKKKRRGLSRRRFLTIAEAINCLSLTQQQQLR
ncbi:hypothetical protein EDC56_2100 [Sinobacterium caligoides]|uniref:Uncharacterized protein n=1 Tax=Sinobacterium caligoides TaxID=933926 RepID=A0A3N2DPF0_9GAMM|nr:hypothetical protein EDC56_2100 [Sinobacterium caligoides]